MLKSFQSREKKPKLSLQTCCCYLSVQLFKLSVYNVFRYFASKILIPYLFCSPGMHSFDAELNSLQVQRTEISSFDLIAPFSCNSFELILDFGRKNDKPFKLFLLCFLTATCMKQKPKECFEHETVDFYRYFSLTALFAIVLWRVSNRNINFE